jgi:hypothetical protein
VLCFSVSYELGHNCRGETIERCVKIESTIDCLRGWVHHPSYVYILVILKYFFLYPQFLLYHIILIDINNGSSRNIAFGSSRNIALKAAYFTCPISCRNTLLRLKFGIMPANARLRC